MSCESTSLAPSNSAGMHSSKKHISISSANVNASNNGNNSTATTTASNGNSGSSGSSSTNNNNNNNKRCLRSKRYTYVAIRDRIPARLVLYFLSWSGFLVSFMMRNDINFALVAMTDGRNDTASKIQSTYNQCIDNNNNHHRDDYAANSNSNISDAYDKAAALLATIQNRTIEIAANDTQDFVNEKCEEAFATSMSQLTEVTVYYWSPTVKSIIITSFYVWYVLSQVVGGIATQYFGTKQVFGWSQFATAASSLCIPFCADLHYSVIILLRSIQGFASGLTWPAMYAIVGHWIPLVERSRFMSSFQGFSIGIGLTYPLCGFIIDNFGWRYVFYTTGSLGMFWCACWYLMAYNTPQQHPRITANELAYIELHVSSDLMVVNNKVRVPWHNIFCSAPAWAIAITTFGRIWIHYIFIVDGPKFMKHILKFDYQQNGFLSGMPFICSYFSSVVFCYIADKMTKARLLHLTNVRKLFTAMSQVVPGLLLFWMCYIELNVVYVLILWFVAVTFITASYAGAMANIVDIAPNFAGPVLAFCQTIHMSASFLSPFVSGQLIEHETQIEEWHTVFIVATVVTILTYVVYQIFGTSEIQKWNYPKTSIDATMSDAEKNCLHRTIRDHGDDDNDGAADAHNYVKNGAYLLTDTAVAVNNVSVRYEPIATTASAVNNCDSNGDVVRHAINKSNTNCHSDADSDDGDDDDDANDVGGAGDGHNNCARRNDKNVKVTIDNNKTHLLQKHKNDVDGDVDDDDAGVDAGVANDDDDDIDDKYKQKQ